jgi:ankyrin repeat protein
LQVACSQGKEESVSLLLKTGFTVNVVDEYNSTPLFWAIYKRHSSIAEVLDINIDATRNEHRIKHYLLTIRW